MKYEFNRCLNDENLSKVMYENYILSSLSLDGSFSRKKCILLFVVLCGYISKEEIVTFTGMSYPYCKKMIEHLLRDELIEAIPLRLSSARYVSRTDTLYTFTKKGYDQLKSWGAGANVYNTYRKKKVNPKNVHDYINGMNLFACLIAMKGKRIGWFREHVYGHYMRNNETLAVDSEITIGKFTLHIEQDIGNEMKSIVLDKIFSYQEYPSRSEPILSSDNHALLFSYYDPNYLIQSAFHQTSINTLASMVSDKNPGAYLEDVFAGAELSEELLKTLNSLYKEAGRKKGGKCVLRVSDLIEMSGFSVNNPFYQNAVKKHQYRKFEAKRKELFAPLCTMDEYKDIRYDLFQGFPIYIAPTLLLERYIRFMCDFLSYSENLTSCLAPYYGELSFGNYSPRGFLWDGVVLRNSFSSKSGAMFVEFPTIELGALMRIRQFLDKSNEISSVNHLIVVVDSMSEAMEIAKWVKDFTRRRQQGLVNLDGGDREYTFLYSNKNYNDIYYLRRSDLEDGKPERLFSVTGYNEYLDDNGNMVGTGEMKIFYLVSEQNPRLPKIDG